MRYEKKLVRDDKSKVKICVSVYLPAFKDPEYKVQLYLCAPNKRKWRLLSQDDYTWRGLSLEDREKSDYALMLTHVTEDEIWAAKIALWEKLKPTV